MATIEDDLIQMICDRSVPASPVAPKLHEPYAGLVAARLPRRPRAVLLDIYGTLVVSASGEVGTVDKQSGWSTFAQSIAKATGIAVDSERARSIERQFYASIEASHERSRAAGKPYPEVDIVAVWRSLAEELAHAGVRGPIDLQRLALAHELAANPVWPMPETLDCLRTLKTVFRLGIVSNAQFYTRLLFPALLGQTLEELGFEPGLMAFSYMIGRAKPDPALFSAPLSQLEQDGVEPDEVVYLGNDMLNDVSTARKLGLMAVLFAGDQSSLRLREGDPRVGDLLPHSAVTSLHQFCRLLDDKG